MNVKSLIDKRAWPYAQNGLRSSAGYLHYDSNSVISFKEKEEKKKFKLDYAARSKSTKDAKNHCSQTVTLSNDVLAKDL